MKLTHTLPCSMRRKTSAKKSLGAEAVDAVDGEIFSGETHNILSGSMAMVLQPLERC